MEANYFFLLRYINNAKTMSTKMNSNPGVGSFVVGVISYCSGIPHLTSDEGPVPYSLIADIL